MNISLNHRVALATAVLLWAAAPSLLSNQTIDLLVFAGIFAVAGLGVGLLLGQVGIVNLAQAVFYGIGAYATAYCTTALGWSSIAAFGTGLITSGLLAVLIGWPILRLNGFFLALATLALAILGRDLFFEWDWLTGGSLGISGIPKIDLLGFVLDTTTRFYYFVWTVVFFCLWLVHNLTTSRSGLAMRAMRDSEEAAMVLAIDIRRMRARVFVLCALLGSTAGTLFAHYVSYISVQSFSVERGIIFLLIPVLGGATSIWGVVIGALFVTFVPEMLHVFGDFHQVLFGLSLVLVVIAMPGGIAGLVQYLATRYAAKRSI